VKKKTEDRLQARVKKRPPITARDEYSKRLPTIEILEKGYATHVKSVFKPLFHTCGLSLFI
jgi:hypothetical protein